MEKRFRAQGGGDYIWNSGYDHRRLMLKDVPFVFIITPPAESCSLPEALTHVYTQRTHCC